MRKADHQQKTADSLQYVVFVSLLAVPPLVPALGTGRSHLRMTLGSIAGAVRETAIVEVID
jgi:hypothetical protein